MRPAGSEAGNAQNVISACRSLHRVALQCQQDAEGCWYYHRAVVPCLLAMAVQAATQGKRAARAREGAAAARWAPRSCKECCCRHPTANGGTAGPWPEAEQQCPMANVGHGAVPACGQCQWAPSFPPVVCREQPPTGKQGAAGGGGADCHGPYYQRCHHSP